MALRIPHPMRVDVHRNAARHLANRLIVHCAQLTHHSTHAPSPPDAGVGKRRRSTGNGFIGAAEVRAERRGR
ncbi:hypothetical protein EXIGLDRAFT_724761, partial [Exidia glandulosa HHB12029]